MYIDIERAEPTIPEHNKLIPCSQCVPEPIAREIAIKAGMTEYVVFDDGFHWRKWLEGGYIARPDDWTIEYWHGLMKITARERWLIGSRIGDL